MIKTMMSVSVHVSEVEPVVKVYHKQPHTWVSITMEGGHEVTFFVNGLETLMNLGLEIFKAALEQHKPSKVKPAEPKTGEPVA